MKKETLRNFMQELFVDIESTVEENISFDRLADKKKVLIIRSTKTKFLFDFLEKFNEVNSKASISLVGDTTDYDVDYSNITLGDIYVHHSRIDDAFTDELVKEEKLKELDAVVFLNYGVFSPTYINISRLATKISEISNADVFSYQVTERKLNFYTNIELFQNAMENMPGLVKICEAVLDDKCDD